LASSGIAGAKGALQRSPPSPLADATILPAVRQREDDVGKAFTRPAWRD
jgi:hypothetical protein